MPDTSTALDVPLSILDLAFVGRSGTVAEAFEASVALARSAEDQGYRRVWYAEHHNIPTIASSATAVLIAHIAAHTNRIRLGAGGIMLPNHSPLVIAEQFGTLATLHPGRIDLGLGRAPGSDQATARAMRRDPSAADDFPADVVELQAFLSDTSRVPGVIAIPGQGTHVPIYILGSSLFGAQVAAALGLPFGFASHFAPAALTQAVAVYRRDFQPSGHLDSPYVIAGVNVLVADSDAEAEALHLQVRRSRVALFLAGGRHLSDDEADAILAAPQGQQVLQMMRYSAVGSPATVRDQLVEFVRHADADELITVHPGPGHAERLRSVALLAEVAAPS